MKFRKEPMVTLSFLMLIWRESVISLSPHFSSRRQWCTNLITTTTLLPETCEASPSLFPPAPSSSLLPEVDEPEAVTKLFGYVNGRRSDDYSPQERRDIDKLIDTIVQGEYPSDYRRQLPGKWRLVYLQPGPDGARIDRRIPFFPDLPFNDNYQIFSRDGRITNIGELLGTQVDVRVVGQWEALLPSQRPQRFRANIQSGKLRVGEAVSIDLPIAGEGLFDSVYLGDRLRIGQNLNGGGARVVQVRLGGD